jgi:hypothetical protein
MKFRVVQILQVVVLMFLYTLCSANPKSGFFLPDSIREMTLKFKSIKNLIILPVRINDSIIVNLILDTGCRNLVLFGKKFPKLFKLEPDKQINFSGFGKGKYVKGALSLNNTVSIESIVGYKVPVVVVPDRNIFERFREIDGIIGYEIFLKFEIEINSREQTISFRPAQTVTPPVDYAVVPLKIVDSKPMMAAVKFFGSGKDAHFDLMIDTGSSMGILLQTTDAAMFMNDARQSVLGHGLNGALTGYNTLLEKMDFDGFEMKRVPIGVMPSEASNHASIGMSILKDYIVVLNYCKAYVCFKALPS